MGIVGNLSSDQLQFFNSQADLSILQGICLLNRSQVPKVEALRKRMDQLVDGFDCSSSASIFLTKNQQRTSDDYFYQSAEKISFFFEGKPFDDDGKLKQPKQLSINKVGHALHDHDPVFKKVSCSDKMSGILHSLGYKRPVIIQSMYIFKQAGIGGEVVPHQENSFLYTVYRTTNLQKTMAFLRRCHHF
ncbi:hypothetical protein L2E82_17735 [Cichorium intybus]|uniref:Uncharacterized protein n=1 Tax=Cichorium intybus TaxID=13427 RepID=A0ACB9F8T2_CICIN|nr:hypothetical protein L2E82_17735 [Cichorium intybus]